MSRAAATSAPAINPTLGVRNAVLTASAVGRARLNRGAAPAITSICGYAILVTRPTIKQTAIAPTPIAAALRGHPWLNFAPLIHRAVPATIVATKNERGISKNV